jgi:hypothetical protein
MSALLQITEGWTGRLPFTLKSNGVAFVGTGLTLSGCLVTGSDGTAVDTAGDFGWVSAAGGTAYYDPDAADLSAALSPYRLHFEVTDGSGKKVYFPTGKAAEIKVHRQ